MEGIYQLLVDTDYPSSNLFRKPPFPLRMREELKWQGINEDLSWERILGAAWQWAAAFYPSSAIFKFFAP